MAGLQAGADDYLEFPFDSARLVAKVSRLLERSRLEASYRDLVEQASDMIFTQDLTGKLTSINLAGQKFLGRRPEEIIGNSFFAVFGIIPESNGFAGSLGRPQEAHEFRHQFVARSAAGEDRWLDLIVSPIKDKLERDQSAFAVSRATSPNENALKRRCAIPKNDTDCSSNQRHSQSGSTTKKHSHSSPSMKPQRAPMATPATSFFP